MEKACEFCTALRPLVYCNADAAYLCLTCDAKVHWANELSGRHLRTLVCNSCGYHLAYVQCFDHKMLICRECDQNLHPHTSSPPHHKRAVRTFMGCPSAKDFAKLWGFEFNEIQNIVNPDRFASISCVSNVAQVSSAKPAIKNRVHSMASGANFDRGSTSQQGQIMYYDQKRQTILQQIVDLKRFQLNEESDHSTKISGLQETDLSPSLCHTREKLDQKFNQQAQNSQDPATNLLGVDSPIGELNLETFSSAFFQLDNVSSSSSDLPLHGEMFWTCKSPLESNQLWSQNIQDLGICEELVCQDDINIPDVDLTFQNYEELFGGAQDPIRVMFGDKDVSCSSVEKDISADKLDIDNLSAMEEKKDASEAVSTIISQSIHENKDVNPSNQYCLRSRDHAHGIHPVVSTMSFSGLRFSAESSYSHGDHDDSALSPYIEGKGYSGN